MRNLLLILFSLAFVAGCGNTLKSSWTDFNAYYNTFYNAKEHFRDGIKKVNDQDEVIDPAEPIRIHPPPAEVGADDFQQAIDKGARVLRKFPDSKWVDDAILLMGKSFYYRQEFFTALENFEQLRNGTESPEMQQRAIIWIGRTQLDLKQYTEAISFLESELEQYPQRWSRSRKGEIQALVGQHYVMLESWDEAAAYLFDAIENIGDKKILGRSYFLQGQVLEQIDRLAESFNAFGDAADIFPSFEYLYWSRYKQGDIARKAGRYNLALDIFQNLRNDDKNLDRRGELLFEIAQTHEKMGDAEVAEQLYKSLLDENQNRQKQSQELKGDIYYRLGRIYSDHSENYQTAAAYFDSASAARTQSSQQEEDVSELADVYGEYTGLQESINRVDSLLYLGSLSDQELDSALQRIRKQRLEELERQQELDEDNTLTNAPSEDIDEVSDVPTQYGFLNYKNTTLTEQSKAQFEVVWGNRPLVDNWRTVRVFRNVDTGVDEESDMDGIPQNGEAGDSKLDLNIEEIPRTQQQKNRLQRQKLNTQYELGNMLFLNLSMPDSARYYFHEVINSDVSGELRPRAMYSLFELFSTQDNTDSLTVWAQRVIDEYPDTRYARRVQSRLEGKPAGAEEDQKSTPLLNRYQQIQNDTTDQKPTKLKRLALQNRDTKLASQIYFDAIQAYIEQAKAADTLFAFNDTTIERTIGDSVTVGDSVSSRIDYLESQLKFTGTRWDSVRFAVEQFDTTFPGSKEHDKVLKLKELLEQGTSDTESLPTCEDLDISLEVEPSMDHFLSQVTYPDDLKEKSISGNLNYIFVVSASGEVEKYERISPSTPFDIEGSFEDTFDEHLTFKALELDDPPEKIRCEVSFPISN